MSLLGDSYKTQSTVAFAIFKSIQTLGAALAFFYSTYIQLQWQLLVLVMFSTTGTVAFCAVDRTERRYRTW